MPDTYAFCSRCQQLLSIDAFTPGERRKSKTGGTCRECKRNYCAWLERAKRDPNLIACHRHALLKDHDDQGDVDLLPADKLAERVQHITQYAQRVEQAGGAGNGRAWA